MKKQLLFWTVLLISGFSVNAQTTLFSEDFETSPVTSILNSWNSETQLTEGGSPCSSASRGNTSDFNSTNVDFNSTQNSSYFLGVNPESPCGGFYNASLASSTQDFSSTADSIVVTARYFISTTLGWGGSQLEIVFDNGTTTDTIRDEFVTTDAWDMVTYKLPTSMNAANIDITINMGGGEGVGLDDIAVTSYLDTSGEIEEEKNELSIYPNPASDFINIRNADQYNNWSLIAIDGKLIQSGSINNKSASITLNDLPNGVYFLRLIGEDAENTKKITVK